MAGCKILRFLLLREKMMDYHVRDLLTEAGGMVVCRIEWTAI